jgi:hypothetical protein
MRTVPIFAALIAAGSLAFAWNAHTHALTAVNDVAVAINKVSTLSAQVQAVAKHNKSLAVSVGAAQRKLNTRDAGFAPLASRVRTASSVPGSPPGSPAATCISSPQTM